MTIARMALRRLEFETRHWCRVKDGEHVLECVIASVRSGWLHLGYQVRLFSRGQQVYHSRMFLSRKLANEEADSLLRDAVLTVGRLQQQSRLEAVDDASRHRL